MHQHNYIHSSQPHRANKSVSNYPLDRRSHLYIESQIVVCLSRGKNRTYIIYTQAQHCAHSPSHIRRDDPRERETCPGVYTYTFPYIYSRRLLRVHALAWARALCAAAAAASMIHRRERLNYLYTRRFRRALYEFIGDRVLCIYAYMLYVCVMNFYRAALRRPTRKR